MSVKPLIEMIATVTAPFAVPTIIHAAQEKPTMQTATPKPVKTGHAAVNGLNYYYAVYGTGEPLLLLHLPALREVGQVGTEHLDLAEAAVKKQQWFARAVHGVVVIQTVDRGMAALGGLGCYGLHGRLLLRCLDDRRDRKAGGHSRNHCDQRLDRHRGSPSAMNDGGPSAFFEQAGVFFMFLSPF